MSAPDDRIPYRSLAGGAGALALGGYLFPGLAAWVWPALRGPLGIEDRTQSGRGYALTFDDGPHPEGTPAVLEILAEAKAKATFFLVGEQLRRNPSLGAEIVAAGHQIGLHCDRHRNLLRLTPWQLREDIARAQATIEQTTGRSPQLYRPPYGVLNGAALLHARNRGWRTVLWSHWGRDWEAQATPTSIVELLTRGVGEGAVLLLHDADDYSAQGSWRATAAALPLVLERMNSLELQQVTL